MNFLDIWWLILSLDGWVVKETFKTNSRLVKLSQSVYEVHFDPKKWQEKIGANGVLRSWCSVRRKRNGGALFSHHFFKLKSLNLMFHSTAMWSDHLKSNKKRAMEKKECSYSDMNWPHTYPEHRMQSAKQFNCLAHLVRGWKVSENIVHLPSFFSHMPSTSPQE